MTRAAKRIQAGRSALVVPLSGVPPPGQPLPRATALIWREQKASGRRQALVRA